MRYSIIVVISMIFLSCNQSEIPSTSTNQYINWSTGDWWVYDWMRYDYNQGDTALIATDTIYALDNVMINGHEYKSLSKGFYPWQHDPIHLRDSSGTVVDEFGQVFFSTENFGDTIQNVNEAGYHIFSMMISDTEPVVVPSGSYSTINHLTTGIPPTGAQYPCGETIMLSDRQFAPGVGMVRLSYHYAAPGPCIENTRELKEYHHN